MSELSEVAGSGRGLGRKVRVCLVTSDREQCGIAEYSKMLHAAVDGLKGGAEITEVPRPDVNTLSFDTIAEKFDVVHLNHHAALHVSWKPEHLQRLKAIGLGVVVTQHDTFQSVGLMAERGMTDFRGSADYLFVHEKVEGLTQTAGAYAGHRRPPDATTRVFMLRQPVPYQPDLPSWAFGCSDAKPHTLGLFGFDFPWKNFDMAVLAARSAGWRVRLWSPNVTADRAAELQALHPDGLTIDVGYPEMDSLVTEIAESCCATAFLYSCGNSGTSGAIRTGIAAQRPLIALRGCRQFRDLEEAEEEKDHPAICWANSEVTVATWLNILAEGYEWNLYRGRIAELSRRDSWRNAAIMYQGCYLELALRKGVR